jgi:hypothetical protein
MADIVTRARVHALLLEVWAAQSCQVNPQHWEGIPPVRPGLEPEYPSVRDALLRANDSQRTSYRWRVDNTVNSLTELCAQGPLPADLAQRVWRLFPAFTRESCEELARRLIAEIGGVGNGRKDRRDTPPVRSATTNAPMLID